MPRPKKDEPRLRCTFTTTQRLIDHIDEQRGYMAFSEYVHRLVIDDYNKKHPKDKLNVWRPEE